ncbi:MAG: hypothetical protein IJ055_07645 [Oscillospiraceae bacterium]|nr:hypothetical protein [Oscillospiraceae bacterium]
MNNGTPIRILTLDRVGVVSEITGICSGLGIGIRTHNARVVRGSRGEYLSDFRAVLDDTEPETLHRLRCRLSHIKGLRRVEI